MNKYMKVAFDEARKGFTNKDGGPFGAVVVKDGKVVGRGHNQVLLDNDPTCHGEIMAIKDACKNLNTFDLSNCDLYTTGQCCTMCLCASMWANIKHIYYSCSLKDNDRIGFRDEKFNEVFKGRPIDYETQINHKEGLDLFEDYLRTNPRNY